MNQTTHFVILRDAFQPGEIDLFRRLIRLQDVETIIPHHIHLECSAVDVSHHNYIEAKVLWQEGEPPLSMRLPHHLVLMILDESELPPPIGFLQ